jgi:hypothetical protein
VGSTGSGPPQCLENRDIVLVVDRTDAASSNRVAFAKASGTAANGTRYCRKDGKRYGRRRMRRRGGRVNGETSTSSSYRDIEKAASVGSRRMLGQDGPSAVDSKSVSDTGTTKNDSQPASAMAYSTVQWSGMYIIYDTVLTKSIDVGMSNLLFLNNVNTS